MSNYPNTGAVVPKANPSGFVPLHLEIRTHVTTSVMCRHLGRAEQTARGWACLNTYPEGLAPLRVNGRLAWPVAGICALLGVKQWEEKNDTPASYVDLM